MHRYRSHPAAPQGIRRLVDGHRPAPDRFIYHPPDTAGIYCRSGSKPPFEIAHRRFEGELTGLGGGIHGLPIVVGNLVKQTPVPPQPTIGGTAISPHVV